MIQIKKANMVSEDGRKVKFAKFTIGRAHPHSSCGIHPEDCVACPFSKLNITPHYTEGLCYVDIYRTAADWSMR